MTGAAAGDGPEPAWRARLHGAAEVTQSHGVAHQYTAVRDEMLQFLPNNAIRVLDIGCGAGSFGRSLRSLHRGLETWAVESDPTALESAGDQYDTVVAGRFPEACVELPRAYFDAIFFNDVLEHMVEPQLAVEAAEGLLRESGVVIASIPNVRHVMVLGPLLTRGSWEYKDEGLLDRTHLRFFTRASGEKLFTEAGWTVLSITGINRRRHLGGEDSWKLRLLSRVTAGLSDDFFFLQYAVVARPPSDGVNGSRPHNA